MFGWKGKSKADAIAEVLRAEALECGSKVQDRWVYFDSTLKFKSDVTLADKIEMFSIPIKEFVLNNYPRLLAGPNSGEMFWLTVFTAALKSGTHPVDDVNKAIELLSLKFAE